MPIPGSTSGWCQAMITRFVGVDITPLEEYFHYFLVPTTGGPCERCITGINAVLLVDIKASTST